MVIDTILLAPIEKLKKMGILENKLSRFEKLNNFMFAFKNCVHI